MTRETRLERGILKAVSDYNENRPLTPGQLYERVNGYEEGEFCGCLRRMADDGIISTLQEMKPLARGSGLSGLISPTLPSAGRNRLAELLGK